MMKRLAHVWTAVGLLSFAALAGRAAGDDWLQHRHDSHRAGASEDSVSLPLTEIWSWNASALSEPVGVGNDLKPPLVSRKRLYFMATRNASRDLLCADPRTAAIRWQQRLNPRENALKISDTRGTIPPTYLTNWIGITPSGRICAYDFLPPRLATRAEYPEGNLYSWVYKAGRRVRSGSPQGNPCMVMFRGEDGQPEAFTSFRSHHVDTHVDWDHVYHLRLLDVPPGQLETLLEYGSPGGDVRERNWLAPRNFWGPPLMMNDRVFAWSTWNMLHGWTAGGDPLHIKLTHPSADYLRLPFSLQRLLDVSDGRLFAETPNPRLAECTDGIVVADDRWNPYLAVLYPERREQGWVRWHRDWPWSMGLPTVGGGLIFTGAGGTAATNGIVALDSGTGEIRWTFAPRGLPVEPYDYALGGLATSPSQVPEVRSRLSGQRRAVTGSPRTGNPSPTTPVVPGGSSRTPYLDRVSYTYRVPHARFTEAEERHPGLVVTSDRVYGVVLANVVAVEAGTGKPAWSWPLPKNATVTCLAASKELLFASLTYPNSARQRTHLAALSLKDGKEMWSSYLPTYGKLQLSLAGGLVFTAEPKVIRAYAPAERTFRMAVDSADPEDYVAPVPFEEEKEDGKPVGSQCGEAQPGDAGSDEAALPNPEGLADPKHLADATVLRLQWGEPLEEMVRKLRERRKTAGRAQMLLEMDWLDSTRSNLRGGPWTQERIALFARTCAQLAALGGPEHFNLAPEVNVYLARYPEQLPTVLNLVRQAAQAIRENAAGTQTLVSLNVEVLTKRYGRTDYQPFGAVPEKSSPDLRILAPLLESVGEIGLTTHPDSFTGNSRFVSANYLLSVRESLGKKPVLVTDLSVRLRDSSPKAIEDQARMMRKLVQCLYWLDARLVACADATTEGAKAELALRRGKEARLALAVWKQTLGWKPVRRLSSAFSTTEPQGEPKAE